MVYQLFTDSAASVGFVGYCRGEWFNCRWSEFSLIVIDVCIELLEMIPIFVACAIWGPQFHCKKILFHSDNLGCVQAWAKLGSSNSAVLSLMRAMVALAAKFNFALNIVHIDGISNDIADSLSRFQMSQFARLAPNARAQSVSIPISVKKVIAQHLSSPLKPCSSSIVTFPVHHGTPMQPE